jgi:hypothetical protein
MDSGLYRDVYGTSEAADDRILSQRAKEDVLLRLLYHPHIFDGIFAGSPGNWYSHLVLSFLWNGVHANVSSLAPDVSF